MVTPSRRREAVSHLRTAYGVSERRGCRTIGMARAAYRYRSVADLQSELRVRLRELAAARVRYGYRRLWALLRREGDIVNHKRIYRLYREEGLAIRSNQNEAGSGAILGAGNRSAAPRESVLGPETMPSFFS